MSRKSSSPMAVQRMRQLQSRARRAFKSSKARAGAGRSRIWPRVARAATFCGFCTPIVCRRAARRIKLRARPNAAQWGGNFRVCFAARGLAPRTFEIIARVQRARGVYYGDSGIWLRRATWLQVGGFPNWPLFEDYELVRRLESLGETACCAGRLQVSARRFAQQPWRVLWLWLELQARFRLGQAPDELARIYRARSG